MDADQPAVPAETTHDVDDPWARTGLIAAANHALDDQGCRGLLRDQDVIAVAVAVLRQHNAWLMLLPNERPGEAFNTGVRAAMIEENDDAR